MQHSVSYWPFADIPLRQFAVKIAPLGYSGIDLLHPSQARELAGTGVVASVTAAPEHPSGLGCIERAFNRLEHHDTLHEIYRSLIPAAAEAGIRQVICFSGNREGLDDATGLANCARGLEPLLPLAEEHGVTLLMELLNSKVDHPDYQCDHTTWGVELCEKLGHNHFKLLYDIYHMQIMEGDLIRTIRDFHPYLGHYHTAGNPGRHEIDASQEIHYPAVVEAIRETGFAGFFGQEFVPTREPFAALQEAIEICRP
ncbi:hydroxypyruvate isomerase family protein [Roseibacillus ishigakijimensis]|uniref:TIM barrel protein n=1 Tax=Roseibacillus ishigakijimensis TaxID=454146 RepID=A0A934VJN5_9BACT|nr:TIM barrel protein [Roseibacillus ishigakijimensis]MBK1832789.1 TIM barrel protein [Roseibacillus ishigakijimensis]